MNIPPENDDGNNEYKLKLVDTPTERLDQLATQMRFRVDEGFGEAIYTIGVTDDGRVLGLSESEYIETKKNLDILASKNNYTFTMLSEKIVEKDMKVYEFLVRESNPVKYIDIKIACAGNVDSGKSSLLGVLLTGRNDDGRGRARLNVFNFKHEIQTGRTSSIAHHILGFDACGKVVNHTDDFRPKSWPEIVKKSDKIITFLDLCGHEKYLRTTIMGLTSQFPDLAMILVGANMGLSKMTKEHIFACLTLHIPFIIVMTKIDICKDRQNVLKDNVNEVKQLLKNSGIRRIPCDVITNDDIILAAKNVNTYSITPIFYVSNVTGQGIDILTQFINIFSKKPKSVDVNEFKIEYHIEQTFQVAGVGLVVGGQLLKGKICVGDKLIIGPCNGMYSTVQIRSIHCKKVPVQEVDDGRYVCLALKKPENMIISKGNVILSCSDRPLQVSTFEAEISVLKAHSTTIRLGYEPIVHTCAVRQAAKIISIRNKQCARDGDENDGILRTGDRAIVTFKFCYKSEFLKKGFRLLLAEGRVKIIGKVLNVIEEIVKVK